MSTKSVPYVSEPQPTFRILFMPSSGSVRRRLLSSFSEFPAAYSPAGAQQEETKTVEEWVQLGELFRWSGMPRPARGPSSAEFQFAPIWGETSPDKILASLL